MTSEFYSTTSLYSTPRLFNHTISAHGFTQNSRSSRVSTSESFHMFLKFPVADASIIKWNYHSALYFLKIRFHLSENSDAFTPAIWTVSQHYYFMDENEKLVADEGRFALLIFYIFRCSKQWKLHNEKLLNLSSSPNVIRMFKSRRMKWAGYAAFIGEKRNT
jgi:hypothetical protein